MTSRRIKNEEFVEYNENGEPVKVLFVADAPIDYVFRKSRMFVVLLFLLNGSFRRRCDDDWVFEDDIDRWFVVVCEEKPQLARYERVCKIEGPFDDPDKAEETFKQYFKQLANELI